MKNDKIKKLKERFESISDQLDKGVYNEGGHMSSQVCRKYIFMQFFGNYMVQYDSLSQEDKKKVNFDVMGLANKLKNITL
jgi:hypothetical protein